MFLTVCCLLFWGFLTAITFCLWDWPLKKFRQAKANWAIFRSDRKKSHSLLEGENLSMEEKGTFNDLELYGNNVTSEIDFYQMSSEDKIMMLEEYHKEPKNDVLLAKIASDQLFANMMLDVLVEESGLKWYKIVLNKCFQPVLQKIPASQRLLAVLMHKKALDRLSTKEVNSTQFLSYADFSMNSFTWLTNYETVQPIEHLLSYVVSAVSEPKQHEKILECVFGNFIEYVIFSLNLGGEAKWLNRLKEMVLSIVEKMVVHFDSLVSIQKALVKFTAQEGFIDFINLLEKEPSLASHFIESGLIDISTAIIYLKRKPEITPRIANFLLSKKQHSGGDLWTYQLLKVLLTEDNLLQWLDDQLFIKLVESLSKYWSARLNSSESQYFERLKQLGSRFSSAMGLESYQGFLPKQQTYFDAILPKFSHHSLAKRWAQDSLQLLALFELGLCLKGKGDQSDTAIFKANYRQLFKTLSRRYHPDKVPLEDRPVATVIYQQILRGIGIFKAKLSKIEIVSQPREGNSDDFLPQATANNNTEGMPSFFADLEASLDDDIVFLDALVLQSQETLQEAQNTFVQSKTVVPVEFDKLQINSPPSANGQRPIQVKTAPDDIGVCQDSCRHYMDNFFL